MNENKELIFDLMKSDESIKQTINFYKRGYHKPCKYDDYDKYANRRRPTVNPRNVVITSIVSIKRR